MIVDPNSHEHYELRCVEQPLMVLLMATEANDDDSETCAINTIVGQALRMVCSALGKIDAKTPPPQIDFSAPIDRMVPRDAA